MDGDAAFRESRLREWQELTKGDGGWTFWDKREPPMGLHPGGVDRRCVFSNTLLSRCHERGEPGVRGTAWSQTSTPILPAC